VLSEKKASRCDIRASPLTHSKYRHDYKAKTTTIVE